MKAKIKVTREIEDINVSITDGIVTLGYIDLDRIQYGIKFAEEWISVEDELPIFDKNKLISGEQDLYLVKMSVGSISPKTTYKVSFLVKEDRWNCECDWNVVTHWQPINRK